MKRLSTKIECGPFCRCGYVFGLDLTGHKLSVMREFNDYRPKKYSFFLDDQRMIFDSASKEALVILQKIIEAYEAMNDKGEYSHELKEGRIVIDEEFVELDLSD